MTRHSFTAFCTLCAVIMSGCNPMQSAPAESPQEVSPTKGRPYYTESGYVLTIHPSGLPSWWFQVKKPVVSSGQKTVQDTTHTFDGSEYRIKIRADYYGPTAVIMNGAKIERQKAGRHTLQNLRQQ